jgi:L-alanine-DL-glutamate epimerase-like enolase superfamily enzyme
VQVTTFRTLIVWPYNTAMVTGNLRTAAQAAYQAVADRDPEARRKARSFATVIVSFMAGAIAGGLLTLAIGRHAIWISAGVLLAALGLFVLDEHREQVRGWAELGFSSLKIKVGREKDDDVDRVALVRDTVGPDVEIMVDGNGAYEPQEALRWAERYVEQGVTYFEEPVSSQDLAGLAALCRRAPGGLAIAAGEYGWNLPYFQRMLDAEAVHILQADVTRCGGITNMLRVDGLCKARQTPFSAHCAPAISVHACAAMESVLHIEYFFDHYRIEGMLFDGTLDPHEGLLTPDRARPGLGLELKRAEAERYQVHPAAS